MVNPGVAADPAKGRLARPSDTARTRAPMGNPKKFKKPEGSPVSHKFLESSPATGPDRPSEGT
jgi:hypothetical protein